MKLQKLHIENYKMFKDFDISFVDEEDNALPIIVLAGVNGSGKTTLLEFILNSLTYISMLKMQSNFLELISLDTIYKIDKKIIKEKNSFDFTIETQKSKSYSKGDTSFAYLIPPEFDGISFLKNGIVYFPSGIDDIKKVETEFVKYWYNLVKFHNKRNYGIST